MQIYFAEKRNYGPSLRRFCATVLRRLQNIAKPPNKNGLVVFIQITIWEINIDPENQPFLVETHIPNLYYWRVYVDTEIIGCWAVIIWQ